MTDSTVVCKASEIDTMIQREILILGDSEPLVGLLCSQGLTTTAIDMGGENGPITLTSPQRYFFGNWINFEAARIFMEDYVGFFFCSSIFI